MQSERVLDPKPSPNPDHPGRNPELELWKPPEVKVNTKNGLNIIILGFIIIIISNILSIISSSILYYIIYNVSNYWEMGFWFILVSSISIVTIILYILFIILLVVSFLAFNKGKFEFGEVHLRNIRYAGVFIITYVVLFASGLISDLFFYPFTYYPDSSIPISIFVAYSEMLSIISAFFIAFAILYLVKSFASEFEKDLLYLSASILIILPIISSILYIFTYTTFSYDIYLGSSLTLRIIRIINWFIVVFTYVRLKRSFDTYARFKPKEDKKFLPRPEPMAGYAFRFYSKPIKALKIFIIVAIIFGAFSGIAFASTYITFDEMYSSSIGSQGNEQDVESKQFDYSESLTETETIDSIIPVNGELIQLDALLTWIDEPDRSRRSNEPDVFSLEIQYVVETLSQTEQNPQGEQGIIQLSCGYDLDEGVYVDEITVSITLVYAGDQTGPLGLGSSPLTIEDNSNEFECVVNIHYIPG